MFHVINITRSINPLPSSFVSFVSLFLIYSNSTPSESTKGLIIQCCALLLRTSNYHLHLLCAKSLFRLKQYHKVQTICQAICSNTTDDPLLTHSAQQLSYLASQLAKPDIQPSEIYSSMNQSTLTSIEPSYFQESGLIKQLLEGAVSPESLEDSSSLEAQFYKTIIQSSSLSLSQKVQKVFSFILFLFTSFFFLTLPISIINIFSSSLIPLFIFIIKPLLFLYLNLFNLVLLSFILCINPLMYLPSFHFLYHSVSLHGMIIILSLRLIFLRFFFLLFKYKFFIQFFIQFLDTT